MGATPKTPRAKLQQAKAALLNPQRTEPAMGTKPPLKLKKTEKGKARPRAGKPTLVVAKIDVGFGNALFIRGEGDGLAWDKGVPLQCVDPSTWQWSTDNAEGRIRFKLLLNDEVWTTGHDLSVEAGNKIELFPLFQ